MPSFTNSWNDETFEGGFPPIAWPVDLETMADFPPKSADLARRTIHQEQYGCQT